MHVYITIVAGSRVYRDNVIPLFALLVLILVVMFIRFIWKALPVYWVLKVTEIIGSLFRRSNTASFDERGFIHFWDLMQLDDPMRQESAGFTEGTYCYFLYCTVV